MPYSDNIWRRAFFCSCTELTRDRCEMVAVLQIKVESRGLLEHSLSWCQSAVCTAWGWRHRGAPWDRLLHLQPCPEGHLNFVAISETSERSPLCLEMQMRH